MRFPAIVAALCVALAGEAAAQVDPVNWCWPTPAVTAAPMSVPMQQAFVADAPSFTSATIRAGEPVGTLQIQPLTARILSGARSELGLEEGALLIPMNVMGYDIDALSQLNPVYCASGANGAVCLGEVSDIGVARSAAHVGLGAAAGDPPMLSGTYAVLGRAAPRLGRNQDWGSLAEQADAPAAFSRTLTLNAIETIAEPPLFERPAYQAVRLTFTLEGYPPFTRDLNEPIRIGDDWLVATAATADSVTIQRMTGEQRIALVNERCPPRRAPS